MTDDVTDDVTDDRQKEIDSLEHEIDELVEENSRLESENLALRRSIARSMDEYDALEEAHTRVVKDLKTLRGAKDEMGQARLNKAQALQQFKKAQREGKLS